MLTKIKSVVAIQTLVVVEKRIKNLGTKLTEADRERKSVEVALVGIEKQAEDQLLHLCQVKEQLVIAREQIEAQKKGLEKKKKKLLPKLNSLATI